MKEKEIAKKRASASLGGKKTLRKYGKKHFKKLALLRWDKI